MKEHFGDVLAHYVTRLELTAGRLAKLTDIPASTIESWLEGRVRRPRRWQDVVGLAAALRLSEEEANRLLQAAHAMTVAAVIDQAQQAQDPATLKLVAYWLERRQRRLAQTPATTANGTAVTHNQPHLPLTAVPAPGVLPPGSRLPISANPLFVGRQPEMLALASALLTGVSTNTGHTVALTGLGGIGKTQLAVEFAHRYGRFFTGGVFWINFLDPAAIPQQIAACGDAQHMDLQSDFDELPLAKQVKLVQRAWREPVPRLLIFDACEEELPLDQWRDPVGGCHIILTSRRGRWSPALGVTTLPLSPLPHDVSQQLLRHFRQELTASEAAAIAGELGHLPLALHLAGNFLRTYRHDIASACYLTELQELRSERLLQHPSLQGRGAKYSPTRQTLHVDRTIALSYEKLDPARERDLLALKLLARAGHLLPGEPIPRPLLTTTIPEPEQDPLHLADALARLVNLGLVTEGEAGAIRVHQLVAAFTQAANQDHTAQADVESTVQTYLQDVERGLDPSLLHSWEPHLRHVADRAYCRQDISAANLNHLLAIYLWLNGLYEEAEKYSRQSLAIRKAQLGTKHLDTAESLNMLGLVLKYKGEYEAARLCYKEVLAIKEDILGPEDISTAKSVNNLGALLQSMEQYDEARICFEQALSVKEKVLGPEHQSTGLALNNLGCVLMSIEAYQEAQEMIERALVIDEKNFGPEHPTVARTLNNLGRALCKNGRYAKAHTCLERASTIIRAKLGPEHSLMGNVYHQFGILHQATVELDTAQHFFEQALAIKKERLNGDHPEIARVLEKLGNVQQARGDVSKAQSYLEQALTIYNGRYGPEHENVQRIGTALAALDLKSEQRVASPDTVGNNTN